MCPTFESIFPRLGRHVECNMQSQFTQVYYHSYSRQFNLLVTSLHVFSHAFLFEVDAKANAHTT